MKYLFKPDIIVILLTLMQLGLIVFLIYNCFSTSVIGYKLINIVVIVLLGYFFTRMPTSVYIDSNIIKINHVIGKTTFNRNKCSIRKLSEMDLANTIRTFGSGGMGGYLGFFRNKSLGRFKMYALTTKELWLITAEDGNKYVLNLPASFNIKY